MPLQLSPPTSTIRIVYDGDEIQDFCLWSQCNFESQANAIPGTARIVVKDEERVLSFTTGKELYLYVDDVKMWGGLVMRVGRQYAFPVDDTTVLSSVKTRQWVLDCSDFNLWFDKRVIRNPATLENGKSGYLSAIITPGVHYDGVLIRDYLPNYIDVPPGVTITAPNVMNISPFGMRDNEAETFKVRYAWVTQGTAWRRQMDEFAARSAATYYINADKELIFQNLDRQKVDWIFVDRAPNLTNRVPIREVTAQEDGSMIVNDALVWGGLESEEAIFFKRYPDPPANTEVFTITVEEEDIHHTVTLTAEKEQEAIDAQTNFGRWQIGEARFQEGNTQNSTTLRAAYLVNGPPGADPFGTSTGLRYPLWRITLTWFAHDIPRIGGIPQHIRPGNLVWIYLYVMGGDVDHPLMQLLPLRNMSISFPQLKTAGEAWVKFQGEFGITYADSRYLWAYLLNKGEQTTQQIISGVNNFSVGSKFGDFATLYPNEDTDGTRKVFTFPFPLISSTVKVYVNGLLWRLHSEYEITDTSEITFHTALDETDRIYVEARTGLG